MAKNAYIITGPESSGSTFISQIIAHVLGVNPEFGTNLGWNGRQFCNNLNPDETRNNDIVILHRSQPFCKRYQYFDYQEFKTMFKGYNLYFILTTRDPIITAISKKSRWNVDDETIKSDNVKSSEILGTIMENEKYFIWNYETMLYLKNVYFNQLYKFLNVTSYFYPKVQDGNIKYIKKNKLRFITI